MIEVVKSVTQRTAEKEAKKTLKKLKEDRKEKQFKYVKVSDSPLTYKEVEI